MLGVGIDNIPIFLLGQHRRLLRREKETGVLGIGRWLERS